MKSIVHRGPDYQSEIQLEDGLIIGNNRLAIIDKLPRSNQPFQYLHFTISFNGAIYNYKEIRKELKALGHQFLTESDTEVVIHAYSEFGSDCVDKFDGMWSFVIYDKLNRIIFGSRDRFGIKPFYYSLSNNILLIASEIKQFKLLPEFNLAINLKMVQYYLNSGGFKNYSNETFYSNISQLEPGYNLRFQIDSHSLDLSRYYSLEETSSPDKKLASELISESVEKRLIADEDPAMMFSGGLDSSIILGQLLQIKPNSTSYSFIESRSKAMDETEYIDAFLSSYNHTNHRVSLPEKLDDLIRDCIFHQDEPPASLSVVAQYLVYLLAAKNKSRLMLSGQGADELFAGYPRNLSLLSASSILRRPIDALSFIFHNSHSIMNRYFVSDKKHQLFNDQMDTMPTFKSIKSYMKFLIEKNGLRDLLHYEDRNSMAHGIETRVPFLSHYLVEFAYHLSDDKKMFGLKRKGILLESYKHVLPSKIIRRKNKLAFDTPEVRLLENNYFSKKKEYDELRMKYSSLKWNDTFQPENDGNALMFWQMKFLNLSFKS